MDCIEWAIERLRNDDEGDDLEVVLLAAATREEEACPLGTHIVERYMGPGALHGELAAGKLIVAMYDAFKEGKESATTLEPKLWRLYYDLEQPDWLTMLARNCEYATDVDVFVSPFHEEFEYVAELWRASRSRDDFLSKYDRKVSASHDAIQLRSEPR